MNLEPIIQSKVSQKVEDKYHVLTIVNSDAINNGTHVSFFELWLCPDTYSGMGLLDHMTTQFSVF